MAYGPTAGLYPGMAPVRGYSQPNGPYQAPAWASPQMPQAGRFQQAFGDRPPQLPPGLGGGLPQPPPYVAQTPPSAPNTQTQNTLIPGAGAYSGTSGTIPQPPPRPATPQDKAAAVNPFAPRPLGGPGSYGYGAGEGQSGGALEGDPMMNRAGILALVDRLRGNADY